MTDLNQTEQPASERRQDSSTRALIVMVQGVREDVKALDEKLADSIEGIVKQAFPGEDPEGHRRYHEAVILAAEDRAAFWKTMRNEISKYGLIGVVGWACYYLWQAFLLGPRK